MVDAARISRLNPQNQILLNFLEQASTVIVEKDRQLELAWTCIVAGGHLLIEDLPGLGKTTMVKVLAKLFDLPWKRIQCTNDLLPADITGGNIFDTELRRFTLHKGPLFSNLVMADELNRASPKSQSAFLQAMEEGGISIDGVIYELPRPYIVIATQNPLDSAGTNPLPESQLDRFMMSLKLGLPGRAGERQLLMENLKRDRLAELRPITNLEDLLRIKEEVQKVSVTERVANYILDLADFIRRYSFGVSPRSTLALTQAARAWAFGRGRSYVIPDDVKEVIFAILCHRMIVRNNSEHKFGDPEAIVTLAIQSISAP